MSRLIFLAFALTAAFVLAATPAGAQETAPDDGLEHLVPELDQGPFQLQPGPRSYVRRLAFSPAVGWLGSRQLYALRLAYNPNPWLGWEASLGHNPGESVQALVHQLSAQVRYPLPWRIQPYATAGAGMFMVFPGRAVNADSVTEMVLSGGLGLEFFLRDDVALRGEWRHLTVLGGARETNGTVAYNYSEATLGFSFYRSLGR